MLSTEWLLITLADALSVLVASLLMEMETLDLRTGVMVFGAVQIACGMAWIILVVRRQRQRQSS